MSQPSSYKSGGSACNFKQAMVDQRPVYENKVVHSRKLKIIRKDLRTGRKVKWI